MADSSPIKPLFRVLRRFIRRYTIRTKTIRNLNNFLRYKYFYLKLLLNYLMLNTSNALITNYLNV